MLLSISRAAADADPTDRRKWQMAKGGRELGNGGRSEASPQGEQRLVNCCVTFNLKKQVECASIKETTKLACPFEGYNHLSIITLSL